MFKYSADGHFFNHYYTEEMIVELPIGHIEKGKHKLCLRIPNMHPNVYLAPRIHLDYIKFVRK